MKLSAKRPALIDGIYPNGQSPAARFSFRCRSRRAARSISPPGDPKDTLVQTNFLREYVCTMPPNSHMQGLWRSDPDDETKGTAQLI